LAQAPIGDQHAHEVAHFSADAGALQNGEGAIALINCGQARVGDEKTEALIMAPQVQQRLKVGCDPVKRTRLGLTHTIRQAE
jgi:hypothetical protein